MPSLVSKCTQKCGAGGPMRVAIFWVCSVVFFFFGGGFVGGADSRGRLSFANVSQRSRVCHVTRMWAWQRRDVTDDARVTCANETSTSVTSLAITTTSRVGLLRRRATDLYFR